MIVTKEDLVSMNCDPEHVEDWFLVRKSKLTGTALKRMQTEAAKAGLSLAEAVKKTAEGGWQGFKAEYVQKDNKQPLKNVLSPRNIYDTSWQG